MKILFIKQLFNPEPTAKSLDFALELQKRGHEVQVLTGFPSYPLGKIYKGYKQKLWSKEIMNGIEVFRVPIFPSQSNNGIKRMLHYLSYAFSASLIGLFLVRRPDVAFVYQGAIPVGIPAVLNKWFRKVPFVYDINDLWPETVTVSGMMKNKRLLFFIDQWCRFNYNQASKITVATPGFRSNLLTKGIRDEKIEVVPNWSRDASTELEIENKEKLFPPNKLNILYAGNLGIVQALSTVVKAAKIFKDEGNEEVNFIFLGDGADAGRLKEEKSDLQLTNVTFLPRVSGKEVGKFLNSADILLVHLKNSELFEITIPSKILSYLRTGKPILLGLKGNAADIVSCSKAGLCFEPENAEDLVQKIKHLGNMNSSRLKEMGYNGRSYYKKNLSIESSTDKLEKVFMQVTN